MLEDKRKSIDLLVEHFWKQGYLTLSRRFGTYLPEPAKVGDFQVDIIARHKKSYAIGITLAEEDFKDSKIIEKINYLATRQTKFSSRKVLLFIGVPAERLRTAKALIDMINPDVKKNIKVFPIIEHSTAHIRKHDLKTSLFS